MRSLALQHLSRYTNRYPRAHAVNPTFYDQVREQLGLPRKLIPTTGLPAVAEVHCTVHRAARCSLSQGRSLLSTRGCNLWRTWLQPLTPACDRQGRNLPRPGLLAVAAAIHACGRVSVYGFGNGSRLSPYYYYKDFHKTDWDYLYLHRPESFHGFRAERQTLQRWHAMGAITWVLDGVAVVSPEAAADPRRTPGARAMTHI